MKLATFNDGSRDGQLMVVSRDLSQAQFASGIATRLQQVLDDWNFLSPQLEDLSQGLNNGKAARTFAFDPRQCLAPLPRAYLRADGLAYPSHLTRLRRAGITTQAERSDGKPLMWRAAGDELLAAHDEVRVAKTSWGIDFEAALAVVTGDVRQGARADEALDSVRLLLLANDWTLRERAELERARGCGFVQSKPATAFAPVAVTPDELGTAWRDGRAFARVEVHSNGRSIGRCGTGDEMAFHFGQLIAHLSRTRALRAGAIVGSGAISNEDPAHGVCSLAEQRALEILEHGEPRMAYLEHGDSVRIELMGADGSSLCGAIEQRVAPVRSAASARTE